MATVASMSSPEISQRDLRLRSKEIMDSVERGQSFTVTRDGHRIGQLIPLAKRRTFISRDEFVAGWQATRVDPEQLRADIDEIIDSAIDDPYER